MGGKPSWITLPNMSANSRDSFFDVDCQIRLKIPRLLFE